MQTAPRTVLSCLAVVVAAPGMLSAQSPVEDPLAEFLKPELRPMVEVVLDTYRTGRKYVDEDFPMPAAKFSDFKRDLVDRCGVVTCVEMRRCVDVGPRMVAQGK